MRVLITGGAGFIGSNLARRLLDERAISGVRIIDDLSTGFQENIAGLDVDFTHASILDRSSLAGSADGCDAIVHLAALGSVPRSVADPEATHAANATGTLRVLQAARAAGDAHVILASSSSVYGANAAMPKHEDLQCMPMSPYAVSKLAAEQYAMAFASCYSLPVLPFRFFNVYGPGQRAGHAYAAVIPSFLDSALRDHALSLHGDGTQSRDFTFVGTVCDVITAAILGRVTAAPTNLAFGSRTTLNDLIDLIGKELGRTPLVERQDSRPGDVHTSQADSSKLLAMFPGIAAVSLESGLAQTAEWMQRALGSQIGRHDMGLGQR